MAKNQQRKRGGRPRKMARRPRRSLRSKSSGGVEFASAKQTLKLGNDPINGLFRIDDINLAAFDRLT